ncbi:MAG TPA: argininosuccinate lyase, partial [Gammaproteobacteria bacterium]
MSDTEDKKPWAGRFSEQTDSLVETFTESVSFDQRLYAHDIRGSMAHARMLASVGVLNAEELESILAGLDDIRVDIERGDFFWTSELEDVHMNIEARLTDRIGEAGKKLHTGRSRNDQVATDIRLYLRDAIDEIVILLKQGRAALIELAEQHSDTIMPGFTHMQAAQPVTFGHHLMAWHEMFRRDTERLLDCRMRVNVMPLGSAALAGTSYPIDRQMTADLLGFDSVSENSLDAVSDRDFAMEFLSACALIMSHLSRMSEELVLWASPQFDFIELPDRYCTGSSIMPQKKNPDIPELIRGKSGRVTGNLVAMLTIMKSQPLAYNRDNQEDKQPLFDSVDTVTASLRLYAGLVPSIRAKSEKMREAAFRGFSTATDLADYLVRKGVPFRDAHEVVGKSVAYAIT